MGEFGCLQQVLFGCLQQVLFGVPELFCNTGSLEPMLCHPFLGQGTGLGFIRRGTYYEGHKTEGRPRSPPVTVNWHASEYVVETPAPSLVLTNVAPFLFLPLRPLLAVSGCLSPSALPLILFYFYKYIDFRE